METLNSESHYYFTTIPSSCSGIQIYTYSLPQLLIFICCNQNKTKNKKCNKYSLLYLSKV